jgi:hypothetical protein
MTPFQKLPTNTMVSGRTEALIAAFFAIQQDRHVQAWRWHGLMTNLNPNYLAEIAAMQAAKRAAGIGPEGMCPA